MTTSTTVAQTTTTTVPPTTTTTVAGEGVLVTRCGGAFFPLGTTAPIGDPVDEEAKRAFDEAGEAVAEEWFAGAGFGSGWTWVVVSRDQTRIVFAGQGPLGFAYAEIEKEGDRWDAAGWGTCHFLNVSEVPGFSAGAWVTDPDVAPDPTSSTLHVLVMERECANGEPPVDREVSPAVFPTEDTIRIVVLIEYVQGGATCPGNPWFATTFDLGEPLGDRVLIDGHVPPGLVRPWPPTKTSLGSGGSEE